MRIFFGKRRKILFFCFVQNEKKATPWHVYFFVACDTNSYDVISVTFRKCEMVTDFRRIAENVS